ncbi:MAG: 3-deoxy-8-phosphooctulonate synthase [Mariprofundaceae bacterium]|nr:3-deoxy-8-phosphooctulonate synthase [Mariprofundaceae bacterium]
MKQLHLANFNIANDLPFVLLAGPCVIEGEDFTLQLAHDIAAIAQKLEIPFVFKASFDKANRTSSNSFRGLGMQEGLRILQRVKDEVGCPVVTDIHTPEQVEAVAQVADILQTPAFLCRQTDFIQTVARCGKIINIKKGQFLSPQEMPHVLNKALETGNENIMLCERGASFGYQNLVSDMRSLLLMKETGFPVVYDATHSVQQPGGLDGRTGGNREFVPGLAQAAVAIGISALFMEVHPNPDQAKSDGPNSLALDQLEPLLQRLKRLDQVVKDNS